MESSRMRRSNRRSLRHFLIPLLVLFICYIRLAETRCVERERRALLEFKNGFIDDYGILSSWSSRRSSRDCCLWSGVGCSNKTGHVITLDLHGYWSHNLEMEVHLSGEIKSSLLELRHLKRLDLSLNRFNKIPEFIGSIRKLHYLNLSSTIMLEVLDIPPQLGNLSYLQTLDLSQSLISFKNTEWLAKLSSLKYLDLGYLYLGFSNNLLENVITRLPSLIILQLGSSYLPRIPANTLLLFSNFSKSLSILNISSNYLPSYSIYPWLFNFSRSLTNIDLSYNEFLGTVSEGFGAFKSLKNLDLTSNGVRIV